MIPMRRTGTTSDDSNMTISSFGGSGNESDYDNNQYNNDYSNVSRYLSSSTRLIKIPVNGFNQSDELTRTDDLLLGDQNEIVLNNNSNIHPTINNNDDDDDDNDNTEARVDLSDDDDLDVDENTIQSTINNNNNNNPQSDNNVISSTNSLQASSNQRTNNRTSMKSTTIILDDSAPPNYTAYRKDPLTARKLLDIRSHLLLNTTLDAT